MTKPTSIDAVQQMLGAQGYVCDRALGTVVFLALSLGRPLFLEGEACCGQDRDCQGAGHGLGPPPDPPAMLRGLDASSAVYEWNFPPR